MIRKTIISAMVTVAIFTTCQSTTQQAIRVDKAVVGSELVMIEGQSDPIYIGGYGSSMVYNTIDSCFYLLTDRGPNVNGLTPESKIFPIEDYSPTIGRFRLEGDSLVLVEKIVLKDSNGLNFVGLPNAEGDGVTGEVAYNLSSEVITNNSKGLDTEGLAIAPDGTFWVSDEYAPFVMQFDRNGNLLRELSPSNGIPSYYAQRRPNRGMEGLTISKDGNYLYGIMQSPLYYPDKTTKNKSVNNRIIEINLRSGATREFIYMMDSPLNVVSEICYISDSVMLVLERDGGFPVNGQGFKNIFKVDVSAATDVSGKSVELLGEVELSEQGIISSKKELYVDIIKSVSGYKHDKPEGIAMYNDSTLCVVNDDDFGITATTDGKFTRKLDSKGNIDKNIIYFIPISIENR